MHKASHDPREHEAGFIQARRLHAAAREDRRQQWVVFKTQRENHVLHRIL